MIVSVSSTMCVNYFIALTPYTYIITYLFGIYIYIHVYICIYYCIQV